MTDPTHSKAESTAFESEINETARWMTSPRFDPFIDFFGLPNEAQLGFPLSGFGSTQGELAFREPGTWILRWQSDDEVVSESWSIETARVAGPGTQHDRRSLPSRRVHRRRATDRGEASRAWLGAERRRTHVRRASDRNS